MSSNGENKPSPGTVEPCGSEAVEMENKAATNKSSRSSEEATGPSSPKPRTLTTEKIRSSKEEDAVLQSLLEMDKTWTDIAAYMNNELGTTHNYKTVRDRASRLDLSKSIGPYTDKYKRWTKEEDSMLTEVCQQYPNWRERISNFGKLSGTSRPRSALTSRAASLGLNREKGDLWTKEETDFLMVIVGMISCLDFIEDLALVEI